MSLYTASLKELYPEQPKTYMLSYWEKNIIPIIVDYCKESFETWRLRYSFEQLR